MRRRLVVVPNPPSPVKLSPGFLKKGLSDWKLDLLALCEYGCRYCSSNAGLYLTFRKQSFGKACEEQLGERLSPNDDPTLTYHYEDIIGALKDQLAGKPKSFGAGLTLVFSMLTDGFSPSLVIDGTTEAALRLLLDRTSFRIRILTKNAVVGSQKWLEFFLAHPGRFVVGLSIGTLNDEWAHQVEVGTPSPSARIHALHALQDAGVPTYGMLCPIFPDVLAMGQLDRLVDAIRPEFCETIWAEPFNNRQNWQVVRDAYGQGTKGYDWFQKVYCEGRTDVWSAYATDLYLGLRKRGAREGWLSKLVYLLYEGLVTGADSKRFAGFEGVSLQGAREKETGLSRNPHMAALQTSLKGVA
jgi:DNA repair photolyase